MLTRTLLALIAFGLTGLSAAWAKPVERLFIAVEETMSLPLTAETEVVITTDDPDTRNVLIRVQRIGELRSTVFESKASLQAGGSFKIVLPVNSPMKPDNCIRARDHYIVTIFEGRAPRPERTIKPVRIDSPAFKVCVGATHRLFDPAETYQTKVTDKLLQNPKMLCSDATEKTIWPVALKQTCQ